MQQREYNNTFGILMAIGIIMVVAGHLDYGILTCNDLFPYYSFHMALFVFISGYFYKPESEHTLYKYTLKKFKKLMIPYFAWNLFYGIVVAFLHTLGFSMGKKISLYTLFVQPFIDGHQFYFNLASWFVPALFIIEIVYACLIKVLKKIIKSNMLLPFLCIVLFLLGTYWVEMANEGYDYSFWLVIVRTGFFLPIYCFGNLYHDILEKRDTANNSRYFGIVVGIQFIICIHYGWIPTFSAAFAVFFNNPLTQYMTIILGIAFWLRIAKIITPLIDENSYLIYIGKHTFFIMMNHLTAIYIIMCVLVCVNKMTGLFKDISLSKIMGEANQWYCPYGNRNFLLLYLAGSIMLCVVACKGMEKIQPLFKEGSGKNRMQS